MIKLVLRVAAIGHYTHLLLKEMGGGKASTVMDGQSLLLEWVWHISQLLACWGCGGVMAGLGAGIAVGY